MMELKCNIKIQLQLVTGLLICIIVLLQTQRSQQQAPVDSNLPTKILIPDLPPSHYQFWLRNHPLALRQFQTICSQKPKSFETSHSTLFRDLHANLSLENEHYLSNIQLGTKILDAICLKIDIVGKSCWGYENNCQEIYLMPECPGSHLGQTDSNHNQRISWFNQVDFGYIRQQRIELTRYCAPDRQSNLQKSSLECTKHFRTCRGQKLCIRFKQVVEQNKTNLDETNPSQWIENIGGWDCDLQSKRIIEESGGENKMQSWHDDFQNYEKLLHPITADNCNFNLTKLTFLMKSNQASSFYHQVGSFFNLYATMHLYGHFQQDNKIIIWGSSHDNDKLKSLHDLWNVFTKNTRESINQYKGKQLCLDRFISVLPSQETHGLYDNSHLVPGCKKSGLFRAFSQHVLHRLNVSQALDEDSYKRTKDHRIRLTVIERKTKFRKILNLEEVETVLRNIPQLQVSVVSFENMTLIGQLNETQNTDILVGIHGSGLTHTLFLPDWAALVELNDCRNHRYSSLARLRGVEYVSMSKYNASQKRHDDIKGHEQPNDDKLYDYIIDTKVLIDQLGSVIEKVRKNRDTYFKFSDTHIHAFQPISMNELLKTKRPIRAEDNRDEL